MSKPILKLYTAPLSGCSARVRIAANLKKIPDITQRRIQISQPGKERETYLETNPNATVPSLVVKWPGSEENSTMTLTQSASILDFLETQFPTPNLLPAVQEMEKRAKVLDLVNLVACDIQPLQGTKVRSQLQRRKLDPVEWARWAYSRGFDVYETLLEKNEGRFAVGNEVTLADCYLFPAVQGAMRVGMSVQKWPRMTGVMEACWDIEEFRNGGLQQNVDGREVPLPIA